MPKLTHNDFRIQGDTAILLCPDGSGALHEVQIDADKLGLVLSSGMWRVFSSGLTKYARYQRGLSASENYSLLLHRVLLNAPKHLFVDHINHEGLDNRGCNLRAVTASENCCNLRKYKPSISLTSNRKNPWTVKQNFRGIRYHIGVFPTREAAEQGGNAALAALWGGAVLGGDAENRTRIMGVEIPGVIRYTTSPATQNPTTGVAL